MKTDIKTTLLRLSKKRLGLLDAIKLYKVLLKLPANDITDVKLFLNNYYQIDNLPEEFYQLFLNFVHSNRYQELFDILLTKNIYELISFVKNETECIKGIEEIVTPSEYFTLPTKQINLIIEFIKSIEKNNQKTNLRKKLETNTQWLLKRPCSYTESEYKKIAIKMFMSIGLNNSIDILGGRYGAVDYNVIFYLFNNLDVRNKKPIEKISFNDFLFQNKKDSNNIMRLMLEGKLLELFVNFDYFYNSIDYFIDQLGAKLNKNKVSLLLKERYLAPRLEEPELSGDVLDDMISSYYHKYGITDSESEILDKNLEAYHSKLKTKTKSSIIKTDIPKEDEYRFELLPLNDARNLVMGYRTGNCFRINGEAFLLFNNFLTNPHMRIISISTDKYKDFGMVLLMRNGNVLIAQGIELSKRVPSQITGEKLYAAVKRTIQYIAEEMNTKDDEIVATIIGLTNNHTIPYNHNILPFIVNPILDNQHQYYNGIDSYQGLLSIKEGKTLKDIKLFVPEKKYSDPENIIYRRNLTTPRDSITYQRIEKLLISLRYEKYKSTSPKEMIQYYNALVKKRELYTICTSNWFIRVFEDGSIDTFINSDDPTIIDEYNLELKIINSSKPKKNVFQKINNKYRTGYK